VVKRVSAGIIKKIIVTPTSCSLTRKPGPHSMGTQVPANTIPEQPRIGAFLGCGPIVRAEPSFLRFASGSRAIHQRQKNARKNTPNTNNYRRAADLGCLPIQGIGPEDGKLSPKPPANRSSMMPKPNPGRPPGNPIVLLFTVPFNDVSTPDRSTRGSSPPLLGTNVRYGQHLRPSAAPTD